jgi:phosphatidylinositol-3-phosphatase
VADVGQWIRGGGGAEFRTGGVTVRKTKTARSIGIAGVLVGVGALLVQYAPAASATKALSAPVFSSKSTVDAKQGKVLDFTVKTKANPVASISESGTLPPGATFTDNGNGTATLSDPTPLAAADGYTIDLVATNTTDGTQNTTDQTLTLDVTSKLPLIRHVFDIVLENNDYSATFGTPSNDPYLAQTLPGEGALLENYYATGHFSNDNYIAMVSGQPPNADNQIDCLSYGDFAPGEGQDAQGIQQGAGCVYPTAVKTIADQLSAEGLTWKGYMEDMGNDPGRDGTTGTSCGHPALGGGAGAFTAEASDGYATRHDPFVYFHSIIDNTTECDQDVVPLGDTSGNMPAGTLPGVTGLVADLASVATTPNFSFITPNLCDDGHDAPCTNTTGAAAGGDPSAADESVADTNTWLRTWVPIITSSPAFQKDGLLEITFDEAEQPTLDTTACCGETAGPAAQGGDNGWSGPGGGKVGAILISPFITPGLTVTKLSYNHFSSLASIEDLFGLPRLGEAQTVTTTFDKHIYSS